MTSTIRPDTSPIGTAVPHRATRSPGSTLAIIGPSASGKSSVVRELARRRIVTVHPTWTTRPRRDDEVDGSLEHRFVGDSGFDALSAEGFFSETVEMFGLPYRYGIPPHRPSIDGTIDLVMLRARLVGRFRRQVPQVAVYLIQSDERQRARWLTARSSRAEDVAARLHDNDTEIELGRRIADRVFCNDDTISVLADRIVAAITADRLGCTP